MTKTSPTGRTLDPSAFIPHHLTMIANTMTAAGSRWFLNAYDFGLNEGRLIGALGNNPGTTAAELGQMMAMNKAIVSRGLALLIKRGLVRGEGAARGRRHFLTAEADLIHREIVEASFESQDRILEGFSAREVDTMLALLRRIHANVARNYGPDAETGE